MRYPSVIADYMRESSCTIDAGDSVHSAQRWLEEHGVREVPVCENGRCCGILTQRDVLLMMRSPSFDTKSTVREVMSDDFYPVMPTAPLAHVVRTMAAHGYASAVVIERDAVKGVFTSSYALRALSELLEEQPRTREGLGPGEVRAVILTEHSHVRCLLARARAIAGTVQEAPAMERDTVRLRAAMQRLLTAMTAHLDLEDRALTPALAALPGYGKERVDQLVREHRRQAEETQHMVQQLGAPNQPGSVLASKLQDLMDRLEAGLSNEEALLLNLDLLRNDGIVTECTAG